MLAHAPRPLRSWLIFDVGRKVKILILFIVIAVTNLRALDPAPASVAGAYRYGDGTQTIALALLPNGNFLAHWALDIFPENGRASGTWRLEGDEVHLTPKKEDGALKGHLRVLLVRTKDGRTALLRKEYIRYAENPFSYFYKKAPNQSPEPTPPAVTPRASESLPK